MPWPERPQFQNLTAALLTLHMYDCTTEPHFCFDRVCRILELFVDRRHFHADQ